MAEAVCAKCGGSGWRIIEREGISGAERCDCMPGASPQELEAAANIPPLYAEKSFDNFRLPQEHPIHMEQLSRIYVKARAFVKEFPFGPKPGLLLLGPTGTGKTHLAVAALRSLMARGFPGLFFDYINLLDRIRSGYDPQAETADREAYQTCLDVGILLVDDLGSHRAGEWVTDTVTAIVTHRCNSKKPLIATTNLADPDAGDTIAQRAPGAAQYEYRTTLAERIGERARSRLFEMCEVLRIPDVGDYRLRKTR